MDQDDYFCKHFTPIELHCTLCNPCECNICTRCDFDLHNWLQTTISMVKERVEQCHDCGLIRDV